MAELAIDRGFLPAYAKLQRPVQHAVLTAIDKFSAHTHAGIHLEKLSGARDPHVRTIRIDQFYRGVVLALGAERYALLNVLPHDDANTFATRRRFTVNQVLGVLEVRDQAGLDEFTASTEPSPTTGLFDDVSAANFERLGIDKELVPLLRRISTDKELEGLSTLLPQVQYDVLTGLASGMSVPEVWEEMAERIVDDVNPDDLLTAAQRTPDRIAFVSGPVELAAILAHPFDVWRTFLHSAQRDVAYRVTYTGPALITGSAGTGKTVTGLHRAVFLARRLPDDESKVLLTTYTRSLADALGKQLRLLSSDPAVLRRIEVVGVDKLAHQIVAQRRKRITVATDSIVEPLWEEAARTAPSQVNRAGVVSRVSPAFLKREWEQVILAQQLTTAEAYRDTPRKGRGAGLRAAQRDQVWAAISGVVDKLASMRMQTHTQLADEAAALAAGAPAPYRHIVVDEGQDLHPAQWRLLRALVPAGNNDMFLLADPHQRIYDSQVSLARLGIPVRGRTRRLTVNYRTTHEILDLSVKVLDPHAVVGLDDAPDSLTGYRSITRGSRPELSTHRDQNDELESLIERVGTWLDQGVEPHAIGVAARTGKLVKAIRTTLAGAYIPVADDNQGTDGVRVTTMHGMKGLEFRCLAVVGLDAGALPAANAVTSAADDPLAYRQDLQRERCLLFVALTRARDVLYLSHSGKPTNLLPALT
ncbi:UvrD-helicase domain-containing protein [Paractinoplanes brasiliensis]|uniref:DNA 3'-5' helicase n=1 Tax=Paractinoplanes brasiliensis TaxID=52695 RepID=A0A4R6JZN2_9ACTN|nr:UvrD-helicase domain-containing protein [Actinoplanes brasiliensis]TDO41231.1 UvrD-like helicase family protein [Actinoplanes brasiliensis]GID27485.1 DNA helicase [Actinoplanes brasiliensis]